MAVNIYDELETLAARLTDTEARLAKLETPPPVVPKYPQLGVVSYFRGTDLWDKTIANSAIALINPGSGPGPVPDSLYVGLVPKCKAAGVPVLGYVHTRYAARPILEVKADIDKHFAWYGVSGIFVDTTSPDYANVPYYADLCNYIKARGGKVCLNPGTKTVEAHAQIADWVMVAETDAVRYLARSAVAWELKYPGKLWHVAHTCAAAQMPAVVSHSKTLGAGLLYVTDDVMANPYNMLPTYFDALVAELAKP